MVFLGQASTRTYNAKWREFCEILARRILDGHYPQGHDSFVAPLSKVQAYKYRKQGLPEVFLVSCGVRQA